MPARVSARNCAMIGGVMMFALAAAVTSAAAQEPVRLPNVIVSAAPDLPGPRRLAGVVRDTAQFTLDETEVSIPSLQRRAFTKSDGTFLFDDVGPGKYLVRAKKIGFASQIKTIKVEASGGLVEFGLLPIRQAMPAVVTSAVRGGLSGVIADTSYQGLSGAEVRVLGKDLHVETDSMGAFYLPAPTGSYMVTVTKEGFASRAIGVSIPPDSGRYLTASMYPASEKTPVKEAWNLADLNSRLGGRNKQLTSFYTRQELQQKGIVWIHDAVVMGGIDQYDNDCMAVLNGGPASIDMSGLTVDDIESIEIYGSRRSGAGTPTGAIRTPPRIAGRGTTGGPPPPNNTLRAAFQNQMRYCATVYVWTR